MSPRPTHMLDGYFGYGIHWYLPDCRSRVRCSRRGDYEPLLNFIECMCNTEISKTMLSATKYPTSSCQCNFACSSGHTDPTVSSPYVAHCYGLFVTHVTLTSVTSRREQGLFAIYRPVEYARGMNYGDHIFLLSLATFGGILDVRQRRCR